MAHPEYVLEIKPHFSGHTFTLEHVSSHKIWQGALIPLEQLLGRLRGTVQIIDHRYLTSK